MDNVFDSMYYDQGDLIGGIDESGVIDIAGPLVASCVILPKIDIHKTDLRIFEVNDSKQIPERLRRDYAQIVWEVATAIGIGEVTAAEFDYLGNRLATKLAMTRAVAACQTTLDRQPCIPDFLMIDGDRSNLLEVPVNQMVFSQGDTKSLCIASASVVAKVYRDEVMIKLAQRLPEYNWDHNKGHPSDKEHVSGLDRRGVEIGVHRVKSKIFTTKATDRPSWKEITVQRMLSELRDSICNLKRPS